MYTHLPILCNHLLQYVNKYNFEQISGQLKTDKRSKSFSTWKTFIGLFVGQVLNVSSIREMCTIFWAHQQKMYHLWLQDFSRSTFSDRINKTPSLVFQELFFHLLKEIKTTLAKDQKHDELNKIYAIDSTLISLTLSVFDRAKYRRRKWWIKVHTRLDISSALPDLFHITEWKTHDWKPVEHLLSWLKEKDVLLFDRWYLDYDFLYTLQKRKIFFVSRTKATTNYCPTQKLAISHPQIQYDAICEFTLEEACKSYPEQFRIVKYTDPKEWKKYEYITNDLESPAEKIADLYKMRREIEELFRRLKQNLKIKQFFWTSRNAVENQVRVAMIYYLIVLLIKTKTRCRESLLDLTRKFSTLLFERIHLLYVIWISEKKLINHNFQPPPSLFFGF